MSYFQSLDSIKEMESTPIGVNFSTIEYTNDSFLKSLDVMSDFKIREIIFYGNYLDYDNFNHPKTRAVFKQLWTNKRFLENVLGLLENNKIFLEKAKSIYMISVNKIIYDYYNASIDPNSDMKDSEVLNLLLKIADVLDYTYILKLSTVIDTTSAKFLAISRFSSFDKKKCINRLNRFIMNLGYSFTIKNIIYIYQAFYSDNFSELFNTTMVETKDNLLNQGYILSPIAQNMYDTISYAIINILNSMPGEEMRIVLKSYASYLMLVNYGGKVRFSLKELEDEFYRIKENVEFIEINYNIPIP